MTFCVPCENEEEKISFQVLSVPGDTCMGRETSWHMVYFTLHNLVRFHDFQARQQANVDMIACVRVTPTDLTVGSLQTRPKFGTSMQ